MPSVELFKTAINFCNDGILIAEYNPQNNNPIVFANSRFEQISGYTSDQLIGQDCRFLKGKDCEQDALEELKEAINQGIPCCVKIRNYTKDGRMFWNQITVQYITENDRITHIVSINKDITQDEYARNVLNKVNILYREMSKRLEYTNETDALTQLKNRGHLSTRGEFILGAAKREKLRLHAILVDVDNFNLLNKIGGENLGDECLVKIAEVIRRYFCRATDVAIRLCDDEFVILCIEDDDQRIIERAEMLRTEVHSLEVYDGQRNPHPLSVSIGIYSVTPEKGTTIEDMVHNAGQLIFQEGHGFRDHVAHSKANEQVPPAIL